MAFFVDEFPAEPGEARVVLGGDLRGGLVPKRGQPPSGQTMWLLDRGYGLRGGIPVEGQVEPKRSRKSSRSRYLIRPMTRSSTWGAWPDRVRAVRDRG